ncbi:MAG: hypothetical protein J0L92_23730 [Deltaproteobacteria bacterium]|nr:hypothetical protein [Deltaproteobacteria bacterium]
MKRRRDDDDAKTQLHARALEPRLEGEPRAEGSADAIFRSFVQRSGGVPEVPADTTTAPDVTPADGISLEDRGFDDGDAQLPLGDGTDPRIPARWAETVEMLLDVRTDLNRPDRARHDELATRLAPVEVPTVLAPAEPLTVMAAPEVRTVLAPLEAATVVASIASRTTPAEGVMLLTARKTAPPGTRAPRPGDDDDARTVSVQAARLVEQLRAAGPPADTRTRDTSSRDLSSRELASRDIEPAPIELEERPKSGRIRAQLETPSEPIELRASAKRPSARPHGEPAPEAQAQPWESVVRAPSEITQRREALRLVPDVAHVAVATPPPSERSEDGLIPSGLLDRKLTDMAVLLRYGHETQVRQELDGLRSRYPQDLLLARRIAEFYLTNERPALALEQLFSLATGLFERRNVEGMKQALEQVLVIEPHNERATRLLGLLEQRPTDPAPPTGRKTR